MKNAIEFCINTVRLACEMPDPAAEAAAELAAMREAIDAAKHALDHAFELAEHHTKSMAKPPLFSAVSVDFYKGQQEEDYFFRNLLRQSINEVNAALAKLDTLK